MSQFKPCVHPVGELYVVGGSGDVRCLLCNAKVTGVQQVVKSMLPTRGDADKPATDEVRLVPPTTTPDNITPEV